MRVSDPRPLFSRRLGRGQLIALDAAAAAGSALVLLGVAAARPADRPVWATCLLIAAIGPPVAVRRLWPLPVFAVVFAASVLGLWFGFGRDPFLVAAFALYTVALTAPRHPREPTLVIGTISVLGVLVAAVGGVNGGGAGGADLAELILTGPPLLGGSWTVGRAVRERRAYAARAAEQLAAREVTEERLRIARELHDVVSHTLSLIGVKAGVAGYVLRARSAVAAGPEGGGRVDGGRVDGGRVDGGRVDGGHGGGAADRGGSGPGTDVDPDAEIREALSVIETTSREALLEMRHMLGVLRSDGPPEMTSWEPPETSPGTSPEPSRGVPEDLRPVPGIADLAGLAERAAMAGVRVDLTVRGVDGLPESLGRSVHGVVREAVTNVIRHAAPARCRVVVEGDAAEVRIRVTDDGPGARVPPGPPGHGIIGMRERVHMHGGSFTAGPRRDGGFEVSARLPRRPPGTA